MRAHARKKQNGEKKIFKTKKFLMQLDRSCRAENEYVIFFVSDKRLRNGSQVKIKKDFRNNRVKLVKSKAY